jgi:hypothetical protein
MVLVLAGSCSALKDDSSLASAWAALGPDSVLLSASTSCKLPPGQAAAQAQMAACVLGRHTGQLSDPGGASYTMFPLVPPFVQMAVTTRDIYLH